MTAFTYTEPAGATAATYLERRAKHLATLNPIGQRVFLKSSVEAARKFPLGDGVSAFDKSMVLTTLQRWLDEVKEAA